jgi:hypothetical protein
MNRWLKLEDRFFDFQTIGVIVIAALWTAFLVGLVIAKGGNAAAAALAVVIGVIPLPIGLVWTKWLTRRLRKRRSNSDASRGTP